MQSRIVRRANALPTRLWQQQRRTLIDDATVKNHFKHQPKGVSHIFGDLIIDRGEGSWLYNDTTKEKYLDFSCGIGVTNTGHCHPRVVKAVQEQASKLLHGQMNIMQHKPMFELIDKWMKNKIMPDPSLDMFFFANSGSEAVEAAVKVARHATGRQNIIVMQGGFHGRTIGAMSLTTSKYIYKIGFGPLMPGVHVTPFPYCHHCKSCDKVANGPCCLDPIDELEVLLKQQTSPKDVAAILIEPVLGEGGYVQAPKEYMEKLRELCDKHGILLIIDEVQSGYARTGKFWGVEYSGVKPDILIMAKGIASGMPLSAIAGNHKLFENSMPGTMGGTYGGNIVACAAANATLDVILEENILDNVQKRSKQLKDGLNKMATKYTFIKDVRGPGLMVGVEFDSKMAGISSAVSKAALNEKLLLLTTSAFETLRFIPSLTVTEEEMSIALDKFEKALAVVSASQ